MTPQQHIRNIYGFDFPEDFFLFYEFAQRLAVHPDLQGKYDKGLGLLSMYLGAAFRVFDENFDPTEKDILEYDRHYTDPPEFFTVLSGDTDGLHWGYYVDIPSENPPVFWVASYYSRDAFQISTGNRTLFQETRERLESLYDGRLNNLIYTKDEEEIAYSKAKLGYFNIIRSILMEYETAECQEIGGHYENAYRKSFPKRVTVADTRCGMGIVAENRWYRPMFGVDKFQIWNYYPDETASHQLHEQALKAIAMGFPAIALKIGKDLWVYNEYNRITHEILYAAYGALNRPILQDIMKKYIMPKSLLEDLDFKKALEETDSQTALWLNHKKISDLPAEIGRFKKLQHLSLSGNELDYLPDEIGELTQLQTLNLTGNNFKVVPNIIGQLRQLKVLRLSSNGIEDLPDNLQELENLEELYLSYTRFTEFPKVICRLKKLKKLVITRGSFDTLPDELNELENLEELEIYLFKPIHHFPKSLSNLKHLKRLKFNSSYDVPPSFPTVFCELTNLEELEAACFLEYPKALKNLQNLTYLKIGHYKMTAFPKAIFKLYKLQKLFASCCKIEELPDEIGNLTALENIYLHGNQIKKIPNSLAKLSSLKDFNIGYNELPKSEVKRLEVLLLNVNIVAGNQK